ncbi:MAG: sigma-70 family RNA polymerase sigma factor [Bacteroidetes bacterium]|nr:sigma-70 family RNA polymerase sigma factor [Bacteroidota bacterium]
MTNISDIELVQGCVDQNRFYQKKLYERFARKMLGVCMSYSRDTYEAENILQESFIKIFENIKRYQPTGSLEGWIRRIVVNTATDYYRKKKRIKFSEVNLEDAEYMIGDLDLDSFAVRDIIKAVQELPEGSRMVFTLYAIEGYTHKEIGETLDISVGTSKSQFSRARMLLQEKLKRNEQRESKRFL